MSDHLPSHDSLPQSLTEFNPSQDNLDNQDDPDTLHDSLSKSGFKQRAAHQHSSDALSEIEKNGTTWIVDNSEPILFKEHTQSDFIVSNNSPDKTSFSGMGFQPAEYSSLQTLKCIINEAKQAERYMLTGDEHNYESDNYMKVHFNNDREVREYFSEDDIRFERVPTAVKKTESQGLVIDFTGESMEKESEELKATASDPDGLAHSKSSYIAGPMRYSKMPEEEAASMFEQRRKELLDSLAKKGKRKNLRIFQDTDTKGPVGAEHQVNSPKEKSAVTGFVIYNTRKPSQNQMRGAESPTSAKKEKTRESAQHKPFPSARNIKTPTGPLMQSRDKFSSPLGMSKDSSISRPKASERKDSARKEPTSAPLVKTVIKDTRSTKKEELSPSKVRFNTKNLKQGTTKSVKNSARDTIMTEDEKKGRRETLSKIEESDFDREVRSADFSKQQVKGKNKDIWADIKQLDQQILQLEETKSSIGIQREPINTSANTSNEWKPVKTENKAGFKRRSKEEAEREPLDLKRDKLENGRESPGKGISSDRYKLDAEDFLIETETDNVYKRYVESPEPRYRGSPTVDESALNIYAQTYRNQNDRRLSNPGEYLYQKGLEQKELRQSQIERRKKEKEMIELSACTFTPSLQVKTLDTTEDFETRSKNWQSQKERKLHDAEKSYTEKEMAECTFYPSTTITSRKAGPVKFDADDFYQRNLEWKKRIETEDVERQNEMMRMMTTSYDSNKFQSIPMSSSRMSFPIATSVPKSVEKKDDSLVSNKSYSKMLNVGGKKPNETEVKVFTLTNDSHRSKLRPDTQSTQLCTMEDDFSHRRRSDQIKRPTLEAFISTDLKDILKRGMNYKSEKNEPKSKGTSPTKTVKDFQLNPNSKKNKETQPNHPIVLTTLRDSFPSKKSPTGLNGAPLGFTDNYSKTMKNSSENFASKGNKYYLSRKSKPQQTESNTTQQEVMSAGYSQVKKQNSKVLAPGAQQLIQGSKVDQENNKNFRKKPLNKDSYPSVELSEDQLFFHPEENRIPLATRQSNQFHDLMNSTDSYSRRNTTNELVGNFEKDFAEFIAKERQPSDKSGIGSLQDESSRKRRTNLSLQ